MNTELIEAVKLLEKEKGISRDVLLEAIESSLITACKNHFGKADNVKAHVDRETGETELYLEKTVVEEVEDPVMEISLADAMKVNKAYQLGDIVRVNIQSKDFGRISTQNAKNVILQKIREEERKSVFDQFSSKEHTVVTGTIQRRYGKSININLGKADATLPETEQVKTESYNQGERIKVYVQEVKNTTRGPKILVSRTHPELVKKLFEAEVAEIQKGIVEIKAIAREAGSRTKMAVWSNSVDVDAIGACVGVNGSRVNAVVDELNGEKIDIINWSDSSAELIENAISPAKIIAVLADDDEKTALVVVPDYQLSLAIGKVGQNARLAAKLTGYKIDIKSESQAREIGLFDEIGYIDDYYDENGNLIEDFEDVQYEDEEGEYEYETAEEGEYEETVVDEE